MVIMKTLTLLLCAGAALAGCAIVPVPEPGPVVYAAPPPVVVTPYYGYGYYGGYRRGWRHWR